MQHHISTASNTPRFKSVLKSFLVLGLFLSTLSPAHAETFIRGDVNQDGAIDISDPAFILGYLYRGGSAPYCGDAADVNDDGILDISDAIALLDYLYQGATEPVAPFNFEGYDITPTDEWSCGDDPIKLVSGSDFNCVHNGLEVQCWGKNIPDQLEQDDYIGVGAGPEHICADVDSTTPSGMSSPMCTGNFPLGSFVYKPTRGRYLLSAGGHKHHCGITSNGSMKCWGRPDASLPPGWVTRYGTRSIPRYYNRRYKTLASGNKHYCALQSNGAASCWGQNDNNECDTPEGVFHHVATGSRFSCGIQADKTIQCWGSDLYGLISNAPEGMFTTISARANRACAISAEDQGIQCWGQSDDENEILNTPEGEFRAVAVGKNHVCALNLDDQILCWGDNSYGQLDANISWGE